MKNLRARLKNLFARDQLVTDGGSVWKDAAGHWRKKRIAKFATSGGIFTLSLFITLATIGLPFPGKATATRDEATEIFARDGTTLLYKIRGDKNRTSIPFEQMPKCIKDATVAVEDKDFYKHRGLDPRGLGRAFVADIKSGTTSQGGSTITQQLVKNALLSNEQTLIRKTKELVLSLEIEQMFDKDTILRYYLNEIPYGNSAYGVQAASQTYFGKDARELTLAQCATLAAIPRAPTFYSPYNNPDPNRLVNRSKYVLDQMTKQKYISDAEAAAAKAEIDGPLQGQYTAAKGEDIEAPHFVFYVREQLEQDPRFRETALQTKGYKVVTTLDPTKQDIAEDAVENARSRFASQGASNAALTSLDPKTGQILAMVGSVDYFDTAHDGNVNVATAERQPGSSFKPIVYTAAFKEGRAVNLEKPLALNPATLLWDVKTDFGGGYAPNNYDRTFRGPVSARDALQQSLNIPAVKMLDIVGSDRALGLAHDMGITTLNDPDRYGSSLVLGGGEVRLVDMVTAYGVMANQGKGNQVNGKTRPSSILEVKDHKGKSVKRYESKPKEILNEALAYQITDVLKDDPARAPQFGRGGPLTLPGREVAAKTGTTDSYRDAWTFGYTPALVAGVWVGNNDNTPMNQTGGSLGAAPIWNEYMRRALEQDQNLGKQTKFDRPDGVTEMKVDKLTGLLPNGGATKTEIFLSNNKPTEKSPTTATSCDKTINAEGLHSERPNNPNWEQPVQAFIKSRGIKLTSDDKSKQEDSECGPDVTITNPGDGETVEGNITIQARAVGKTSSVTSVEFAWDGKVIDSDGSPPFTTNYTITDDSGTHTISAKAADEDGNSKTATISVKVGGESPSPVTLSLSCTGHTCVATASDDLDNVVLVNASNPGQTVNMTGSGGTYTVTAPASWTSAYAQGVDEDGKTVKSGNRTLSFAPYELAFREPTWLAFL